MMVKIWIEDHFVQILIGVVVLCVIGLVSGLLYGMVINNTPIQDCVVIEKRHYDSYTMTTYIKCGDVLVPITTQYPERYTLLITGKKNNGAELTKETDVDSRVYGRTNIGDKLDGIK